MSLHFNWARLDETCAEALRQLLNKRLSELVERINDSRDDGAKRKGKNDGADVAAPRASHDALNGEGIAVSAAAGGAGLPCGGGNGNFAARTDYSPSGSNTGTPLEVLSARASMCAHAAPTTAVGSASGGGSAADPPSSTTAFGAGAAASNLPSTRPSHLLATPSAATSAIPGTAALFPTACLGSGSAMSSTGTWTAGAVHLSSDHNPHATAATHPPLEGSKTGRSADRTSLAGGEPLSPPPLVTAARRHSLDATSTINTLKSPTGTTVSSGARFSAAAGAAMGASNSTSTAPSPAHTTAKRAVPPIVYLEVGRLEWGATPPFLEIVAFENAIEGPPGCTPQHPYPQRQIQPNTERSSAAQQCSEPVTPEGSTAPAKGIVAGLSLLTTSASLGMDREGETSQGSASRLQRAPNLARPLSASQSTLDVETVNISGAAAANSNILQGSSSSSQSPLYTAAMDSLTSIFGPGGLYVRLHITYGGAMQLSVNVAVQHEVRLGPVALKVSLPATFYLANLDLDCYLCLNMKCGACEIWLEHGPLSSSVVNRLSVTAAVGGEYDDGDEDGESDGVRRNEGAGDYAASSTDFFSRFGSSSLSEGDDAADGSGVYVNEHEVTRFVVHELRTILADSIMAPHSIRLPLSFGGE